MAVVFEKTKGLTDAKLHYCPGCAHGIVHRLVVVQYLQTTTSTLTQSSVRMVVLPQQQQVSREYIPNRQYLHIRAMVTLLPSVHVKSFMQQRVVKRLQQSSSTTVSTA